MNINSIKDQIKNISNETGKAYQDLLIAYGLERTIYRISISKYADNFILKGGIFLYALFDKNYSRVTTDIDFLAQKITNSSSEIKKVFKEIFSIKVDDGLVFDIDSLTVTNITEFKDYHGLNIKIMGYLDKTKIPISIDIGYDDIVYPYYVDMEFPTLLDNDAPTIKAYSIETVIAEKFEAIVSNGFANSRYKDFYDIYVLADKYPINKEALRKAIIGTFNNRKTVLSSNVDAFSSEFYNDQVHISRWNSFIKKKKTEFNIPLKDVVLYIKELIIPIII